jgi:hypothetical protein
MDDDVSENDVIYSVHKPIIPALNYCRPVWRKFMLILENFTVDFNSIIQIFRRLYISLSVQWQGSDIIKSMFKALRNIN